MEDPNRVTSPRMGAWILSGLSSEAHIPSAVVRRLSAQETLPNGGVVDTRQIVEGDSMITQKKFVCTSVETFIEHTTRYELGSPIPGTLDKKSHTYTFSCENSAVGTLQIMERGGDPRFNVGESYVLYLADCGPDSTALHEVMKGATSRTKSSAGLSDAEAEEMLARLSKHYKQPVMPIKKYCQALETWRIAMTKREREDSKNDRQRTLYETWIDIRKSNLLYRLLYLGEPLRTVPCPIHRGRWQGGLEPCTQCQGTGWLPEPAEKGPKLGDAQ